MRKRDRWGLRLIATTLGLYFLAGATQAGEWPGWRGPTRDGRLGAEWNCSSWPEELDRRWSIPVGTGHSSPIVADERVFQLSREGEEEVVRAVDIASGRELWRQSYPIQFKPSMGSGKHGAGPKSTPAFDDGRLFTLGITGVLTAWDAASGRLLWRLDAAMRFENGSPKYGASTSPLVDEGRLIVYLGGKDDGALLALDVESGDEIWSSSEGGPAYASPVVAELDGVRQVVTPSELGIISVESSSGRMLWKIPAPISMTSHNAATPLLLADGSLVLSTKKQGLRAVRPRARGESWEPETLWSADDVWNDLSSPVAEGDRIFGLSPTKKGRLFALEAATGRAIWTSEGRDAENAALLTSPGIVLVLTSEGELWVLDSKAETMSRLADYRLSDEGWTWAHPAVVDDRILIKDRNTLALWVLECAS